MAVTHRGLQCAVVASLAGVLLHSALIQAQTVEGQTLPDYCKWIFIATGVVCGFAQAFFGYKLFRITLFVAGFLVAGVCTFVPVFDHAPWSWSLYLAIGLAVVVGGGVGALGAFIPKIGVFLVGASAGVVGGFFVNGLLLFHVSSIITISAACAILGLVAGVLAIFLMRIVVVIATSILGGFMVIYAIGNCPSDPSQRIPDVFHLSSEVTGGQLDGTTLPYFAAWGVLSAIGVLIQFCITAKKPKDKEGEQDEWEKEVDSGGMTLGGKKGKKDKKGKKEKDKKGKKLKADALLHDYEAGGEFYEAGYDSAAGGARGGAARGAASVNGGYDEYAGQEGDGYGYGGEYDYGYGDDAYGYDGDVGAGADAGVPRTASKKSAKGGKKKSSMLSW